MTDKQEIKTLFFDLGNVLVDFDHSIMWQQLSKICKTKDENLKDIIYNNDLWKKYEKGLIRTEDFISQIESFLKCPISHDKFISAASEIFSPNPEMKKILEKLKNENYELFLISNTCDIHFNYIKKNFDVTNYFNKILLSYELHLAKPEPEIFKHALSLTKSSPEQCLFIDDLSIHTDAANSLGISSHVFKDAKQLRKTLQERGINV